MALYDLKNFINVDKLRVGGHETEHCLYILKYIVIGTKMFDEEIVPILDNISHIDFNALNSVHTEYFENTYGKMDNAFVIVSAIYDILYELCTKDPKWMHRCKLIDISLSYSNSSSVEALKEPPINEISRTGYDKFQELLNRDYHPEQSIITQSYYGRE